MSNVSRRMKATPPPGGWINRTYRLARGTVEDIDRLAAEFSVNKSDLVSFLLEVATTQLENGTFKVPIVTREIHSVDHHY